MARTNNALARKVQEVVDGALKERIPSRYALRVRLIPRGYKDLLDVVVITDYFRGKGFFKRTGFVRSLLEGTLTPSERLKIAVIPFTEREAEERGL
jgi:stress-induced morphogen